MFEIAHTYDKKQNAAALHHPDNVFQIFYEEDENLFIIEAPTPYGDFSELVFTEPRMVAANFTFNDLLVRRTRRDKFWFIWETDGDIRIAPWPDDSPPYEVDDPYRLYYAVDTKKLYMNINQRWQFIGSPSHKLLQDIGIHTHDELDELIGDVEGLQTSVGSLGGRMTTAEGKITSLEGLVAIVEDLVERVEALEGGGGGP